MHCSTLRHSLLYYVNSIQEIIFRSKFLLGKIPGSRWPMLPLHNSLTNLHYLRTFFRELYYEKQCIHPGNFLHKSQWCSLYQGAVFALIKEKWALFITEMSGFLVLQLSSCLGHNTVSLDFLLTQANYFVKLYFYLVEVCAGWNYWFVNTKN